MRLNRVRHYEWLMLLLLAFAARALTLLWGYSQGINPLHWDSDSWEYTAMVIAIQQGDWAFNMFTLRAPFYSIILSGFISLFSLSVPQLLVWFHFQNALTALGVVLGAKSIYLLTGRRSVSLIGGLILCLHPIMLSAEVPLLSESLFNVFCSAGLYLLLNWIKQPKLGFIIGSATCFAMAVFTRATGQYLLLILVVVMLLYDARRWKSIMLFVAIYSLPIIGWTAHQQHYYGINTYSTAGVFNLAFYKSISTERLFTDESAVEIAYRYAERIERAIGDDAKLSEVQARTLPPNADHDYLYVTNANRYQEMAKIAQEKLFQYHAWHLVKMPYHILQMFHRNGMLEAYRNTPLYMLGTATTVTVMLVGAITWLSLRPPLWKVALVLGSCAYFIGGSAFYLGLPAQRFLSPIMPYGSFLMAYGGIWMLQQFSRIHHGILRNNLKRFS
ncbi:MAG: hypothetical protein ACOYLB_13940 [Phototrophicaceae bacterium]